MKIRLGEQTTFSVPIPINEKVVLTFSDPPEPLLLSRWKEDAPGLINRLRRWIGVAL